LSRKRTRNLKLERRQIEKIIRFKDIPYNPFRRGLYTVKELMKGYNPDVPGESLDEVIADHYNRDKKLPSIHEALAQRIHDHAIDTALYRFAKPKPEHRRKLIGIMGGHSRTRADKIYQLVAHLTWQLRQEGFAIVSGGGPGIMEAANLGAYLSSYKSDAVDQAIEILSKNTNYKNDRRAYINAAFEVRKKFPEDSGESLAIPTWAYSDEPMGQFSSWIGKYFSNSIREDGLLAIAADCVVFAPGSAGTLQEIFQDATHNSYWTFKTRAPMVFLEKDFYSKLPSIFDVVKAQAHRPDNLHGPYDDMVEVCATAEEIVDFIRAHPIRYEPGVAPKRTFGVTNLRLA
jgi:predicted Rossmann-fold nucleotide-binding protein